MSFDKLLQRDWTHSEPHPWGLNFTKNLHRDIYPNIDPKSIKLSDGYTVVVTGASYGMGEHIAKAFGQAGATNMVLVARTGTELERVKAEIVAEQRGTGINVSIVVGDATKPQTYDEIYDLINSQFNNRLDCLVCNAGGGRFPEAFSAKIHETSPEDWQESTELNYLSVYYAARRLIPLLLQSKGKTLINITSLSAHMVEHPPFLYNIAKLASTRLSESIAATYKDEGLLSFAMHPGGVKTPGSIANVPQLQEMLKDQPQLAAGFCVWLAKERPDWLSGRYLSATWDVGELAGLKEDIVKNDKLKFRMVL